MKIIPATILLLSLSILSWLPSAALAELLPGDAERGERVFRPCRTCHYPEQAVGHNNGPSLWNIIGQPAGKQEGFDYSASFKAVDFSWTPALLDIWLQGPARFVPGNLMMSPGIQDAQQRADLIAYLATFSE